MNVIEVEELARRFGQFTALARIGRVQQGEGHK
jgi:hypothetical protein